MPGNYWRDDYWNTNYWNLNYWHRIVVAGFQKLVGFNLRFAVKQLYNVVFRAND